MSIILAKLITAMTKEGKFKDAIQDKIGATVDTTDLKKQLSVLNASLHQAETIKTRLEQQMDNLDVTDTHYDKKISDLQRRMNIWFPWKSYQHLRAWFYFAGKWSIIVFQFAVKWCRIKTTFHV